MRGIHLAGLAVVSQRNASGVQVGGLALVAEGDLTGLSLGGLATVSEGDQTGINLAGLATVTEGTTRYLSAAGLAVVAGRVEGAALSLGKVYTPDQAGLAVSAYNDIRGVNRGLSIAIYNYARTSPGLQVGLINYVRDNRDGLRLLPCVNRSWD